MTQSPPISCLPVTDYNRYQGLNSDVSTVTAQPASYYSSGRTKCAPPCAGVQLALAWLSQRPHKVPFFAKVVFSGAVAVVEITWIRSGSDKTQQVPFQMAIIDIVNRIMRITQTHTQTQTLTPTPTLTLENLSLDLAVAGTLLLRH
eukprot:6210707-Pleurochrysis_carterae.AAC.1